LDASDLDAVEGELVNLIACGGQPIVLDLGGISGMADRTPAALARVHRACVVAGGQLKPGDLCPALAGAAASAGMGHVLEILPNEDSALEGARPAKSAPRPLPVGSRGEMVSPTSKGCRVHPDRAGRGPAPVGERARLRAATLDEAVSGWLAPVGESRV